MITRNDIIKDLNDWRKGKMGWNALMDAIDRYAEQSNSHKHSVSGKRPMLTEIQIVQAMAAVDEARQKLEALLAACASGAVDTATEGGMYCVSSEALVNGNPCKEWCGDKSCWREAPSGSF